MLKQLELLKNRLSTIRSDSWHLKLTSIIWKNADKGKACTYVWFRFPTAVVALFIVAIVAAFVVVFRFAIVFVARLFGYRYNLSIRDLEDDISNSSSFTRYQDQHIEEGPKNSAPGKYLSILPIAAAIYYLAVVQPYIGIAVVLVAMLLAIAALVIFVITKGWKFPPIVYVRAQVVAAWDKVCPQLVVIDPDES